MGKALFNENPVSVSFETLPGQEYPKVLDMDVTAMKKKVIQLLSVVTVCGALLVLIGFSMPDFTFARTFGILVILTSVGYFTVLFINLKRAVSRITIEQNGFSVNNDHFVNDGMLKVTIKPFFPIAGAADNVYLTVFSSTGKYKYWFGVKEDETAKAARSAVKSALSQLAPPIHF